MKQIATAARRDIQGLRAIAVCLVIADHLIGHPSGGFIGVDVFFVLSGFLITGLLVRERERTGRISLRDFYARRARRILPVAVLVLIVTVAASWILLRTARAAQTTVDAVWSLLFAGNWRFAVSGTDYMQAGGRVSPVQHFWSLAVEEQFYVVWPWLLLLAFLIGARFGEGRAVRVALSVVIGVAILVSLAWAFHEVDTARTFAYFSTFSRAWELGVGALLAVGASQLQRLPDALRPVLAWLGLAVIAASTVVVDRASDFPAPWAIPAVLGTALVIAAGTGGRERFLWPITNPVARYLGDISYSLYLWHFPVIVLGQLMLPAGSRWLVVLPLVATLALSVASYHLVEDPIRRSSWLAPRSARPTTRPERNRARFVAQAVGGVAVLALVVAAVIVPVATAPRGAPTASADALTSTEVLAAELEAATTLQSWPALSPSIDELPSAYAPEWTTDGCLNVDDANRDDCVYGDTDAPKLAVLLGDSVGISWMPGLRDALEPLGYRIQSLTFGECPAVAVDATRFTADSFTEECTAHHGWTTDQVAQLQPDLVILASAASTLNRLASGATGEDAVAEWREGTVATLTDLRAASPAQLVLLSSPPTVSNPQTCATRVNGPADCLGTPEATYDGMVAVEAEAAAAAGALHIAPLNWFCTPGRLCPPIAGATPTYIDNTHITAAYSRRLAPLLADAIL